MAVYRKMRTILPWLTFSPFVSMMLTIFCTLCFDASDESCRLTWQRSMKCTWVSMSTSSGTRRRKSPTSISPVRWKYSGRPCTSVLCVLCAMMESMMSGERHRRLPRQVVHTVRLAPRQVVHEHVHGGGYTALAREEEAVEEGVGPCGALGGGGVEGGVEGGVRAGVGLDGNRGQLAVLRVRVAPVDAGEEGGVGGSEVDALESRREWRASRICCRRADWSGGEGGLGDGGCGRGS